MDLRNRLGRVALDRPAVLLVTAAGATRERLAVEAELARRRWPRASGPAAADLVAFAGAPAPAGDDDWAERLWNGVPAPKARVRVRDPEHAAHALEHGRMALLVGAGTQGRQEQREPAGHERHDADGEHPPQHDGHTASGRSEHDGHTTSGPSEHDGHGHDAHQDHGGSHAGTDQGHHGHGGSHPGTDHDHHGHHMGGAILGLPMAERADDRDGLRLDRLHVPLGPALPDWPAGLVVRTELQGDVVQRASVEALVPPRSSRPAFWSEPWLRSAAGAPVTVDEAARRRCAAHLDSVGRFLAVAGWRDPAAVARRARDQVLGGASVADLRSGLRTLTRRVRRSWTLRWLTSGVGVLSSTQAQRYGVTGPALLADGDAYDRLLVWLEEIDRAVDACDDRSPLASHALNGPRGRIAPEAPASRTLVDVLPVLLEGTEFACARLVVASLDPDLDELAPQHARGGHAHG
ncbi:hypothetical protein [Streptomyces nymphaeiformis]|uniref:Uncharacterized protein n=1 Tax=Streptomyces nymphaeiformis TaxID=2663842 RepID=A0A7W7XGK6_9ACTN|nr:hypothetical protein [Streptomyces nymphaeiformis]MBB4986611.1 hypothetical protein [Streptomyces nymphaeiformis]